MNYRPNIYEEVSINWIEGNSGVRIAPPVRLSNFNTVIRPEPRTDAVCQSTSRNLLPVTHYLAKFANLHQIVSMRGEITRKKTAPSGSRSSDQRHGSPTKTDPFLRCNMRHTKFGCSKSNSMAVHRGSWNFEAHASRSLVIVQNLVNLMLVIRYTILAYVEVHQNCPPPLGLRPSGYAAWSTIKTCLSSRYVTMPNLVLQILEVLWPSRPTQPG